MLENQTLLPSENITLSGVLSATKEISKNAPELYKPDKLKSLIKQTARALKKIASVMDSEKLNGVMAQRDKDKKFGTIEDIHNLGEEFYSQNLKEADEDCFQEHLPEILDSIERIMEIAESVQGRLLKTMFSVSDENAELN